MIYRYWLLTFSLTVSSFTFADNRSSHAQLKQTISDAIIAFEHTDRTRWSYQVSRYENEEGDVSNSIERHRPHADINSRWSLISQNGKSPSKLQARKFLEKKRKELTRAEQNNISLRLRELIQLDSLKLESETAENLTASFDVNLSQLGDDAQEQLNGLLVFNKQLQFIEIIEITNLGTFSPMFTAEITQFKMSLTFFKINDAILPHEQRLNMQGTFAFFTEILEESIDTFSDYQYVPEFDGGESEEKPG